MSLEYGYGMVILFSEVPQSEGRVLAGGHHEPLAWVGGAVGQLIVMARQLLDTLTRGRVPDGGQPVPAPRDHLAVMC